jgi:hypothetical protein
MPLTCISWCFAITGAHRQERKMNYFNAENWEGTAAEIETANEAFEIVLAHLMKIDGEDFDEEFMTDHIGDAVNDAYGEDNDAEKIAKKALMSLRQPKQPEVRPKGIMPKWPCESGGFCEVRARYLRVGTHADLIEAGLNEGAEGLGLALWALMPRAGTDVAAEGGSLEPQAAVCRCCDAFAQLA